MKQVGLRVSNVSVIIPTCNRADTIKRAVRSALNQTCSPLEVLVCDDGSTDNSHDVIQSINDPRVTWIPGTHSGLPAVPRNRGIKESKGEWLAFLDSDDEWLPEKLEKQLSLLQKHNRKAACSNAYRFVHGKGIEGDLVEWKKESINFDDLLKLNHVICSSAIVHRSLFNEITGFSEKPELKAIEDYALWLFLTTKTDFAFVNESLLIYYDDPLNSIRRNDIDVWAQRRIVLANLKKLGQNHNVAVNYLKKIDKEYLIALFNSNKIVIKNFIRHLKTVFPG